MDLKTFLSVLLVYRSNFHVLHWMAKGKNFFKVHDKAAEYYDEILKDVDIIAEMILRRSETGIVNYAEALTIIEEYEDHEFLLVGSNTTYDIKSFVKYATRMFDDILFCIEELLDSDFIKEPKNVGMKATLEGMYDKYDLQSNYLLKRIVIDD